MIEFVTPLKPSMALDITLQRGQMKQARLSPDALFGLDRAGPTWGVLLNGKPVAVGGHVPAWKGRTILWGYLGAECGPALIVMTREVRKQIKAMELEFPRMEAYAERHHKEGHRWLRLLGFKKEGAMRKFCHGVDYTLYSRVT